MSWPFEKQLEIRREDGELAARVPPEGLARAVLALDRTDDFTELESTQMAPA